MNHDDDATPPSEGWQQLAAVWNSSSIEPSALDPALALASRDRAARLARTVAWRNARELLAAALLVAVGVAEAALAREVLLRVGFALMAAGALWIAFWMHRQGRNLNPPGPDATTTDYLAHEAAQLRRQAELLGKVRTHYLLPLAPSVAVILASSLAGGPPPGAPTRPVYWAVHLVVIALVAGVFVGIDRLNRRAGRQLRERLERLLGDPAAAD